MMDLLPTRPLWLDAALLALMFAAGWITQGWQKDAEISRLETRQQQQRNDALNAALIRLDAAGKVNEQLAAGLAVSENARTQLAEEKDREIRRLTTGRRCLDAAVVRVLNADAAVALPPAGAEPVSADAAFATDTDVGLWARTCRDRYDTCRGRLEAVNAFYRDADDAR
jgi:hypothetical protein